MGCAEMFMDGKRTSNYGHYELFFSFLMKIAKLFQCFNYDFSFCLITFIYITEIVEAFNMLYIKRFDGCFKK